MPNKRTYRRVCTILSLASTIGSNSNFIWKASPGTSGRVDTTPSSTFGECGISTFILSHANDLLSLCSAKYQPYDLLRHRFWQKYLAQYDTDDTNAILHVKLTSLLDSLGLLLEISCARKKIRAQRDRALGTIMQLSLIYKYLILAGSFSGLQQRATPSSVCSLFFISLKA